MPYVPSNPQWARQLRNPAGTLLLLAVPVLLLLAWRLTGGSTEHWLDLLLLGWLITGVLPVALTGVRDPQLAARWRALPVGSGDRYVNVYGALFPISLVTTELLVLGGLAIGPAAERNPLVFSAGAIVSAVMVALGLAVASWSRNHVQLTGGLGLVLAICVIGILPGTGPLVGAVVPTAIARAAMLAIGHNDRLAVAFVKLLLEGLVFVLAGLAGFSRR